MVGRSRRGATGSQANASFCQISEGLGRNCVNNTNACTRTRGFRKKDNIAARVVRWHVEWPLSLKVSWPLPAPTLVHSVCYRFYQTQFFPSSLPEISKRMHSLICYLTYRKVADDECGESPTSKYLVGNLEGSTTTIAVVLVVPLFVSRSTAIVFFSFVNINLGLRTLQMLLRLQANTISSVSPPPPPRSPNLFYATD